MGACERVSCERDPELALRADSSAGSQSFEIIMFVPCNYSKPDMFHGFLKGGWS